MAADSEEFRRAMRQWTTGVAVATSRLDNVQHGMTVNSFTSISLTPPLVLISLEKTSRTHRLIQQAGFFGITILGQDQREISDCFAGRHTEQEDRFSNLETHTMVTGVPMINGGLAYFDCQVVATYGASTHTLFIGEVLAVKINGGEQPLVYYNRSYKGLHK